MAEQAMAVDPPAPTASTSALPAQPLIPTPLLIITTVNSNGRIITAPTFILKALPAAIAAKPIPCQYTGTMEVWPGIWLNAEKAHDLSDHMKMTPTVQMLKHLETHIIDVVEPPKDHFLKRWSPPCDDFFFTEEDFLFLLGSKDPLKQQCLDDGTISLGSPSPPPDFASTCDQDYFVSVQFLNHELNANDIEQGPLQQASIAVPTFFGSYKNIFSCSVVNTSLYGLVCSNCPSGMVYKYMHSCPCEKCK